MAREVVTQLWCDKCLVEDDKRVTATSEGVVLALGTTRKQLDLCEACATALLTPVEVALTRYGNPVEVSSMLAATRPQEGIECPRCGKTLTTRSSTRTHLMNVHGVSRIDSARMLGATVACSQCDFLAVDTVGLSTHERSMHGRRAAR